MFREDSGKAKTAEELYKAAEPTQESLPKADLGLPMFTPVNNKEYALKVFRHTEPEAGSDDPHVYTLPVHRFKQLYLCPGATCRSDPSEQMPCAKGFALHRKREDLKELYYEERKQPRGLLNKEVYAAVDYDMKMAKKQLADSRNFYLVADVTPLLDKSVGAFKECYGQFTTRNTGQTDEECSRCPWAQSCQKGLQILDLGFSKDARSWGKRFIDLWSKTDERRLSIFNSKPTDVGGVRACRTRLITYKVSKTGGQDSFPALEIDVTDGEVAIPAVAMKYWIGQISGPGHTMSEMIRDRIKVSNEVLIEASKQASPFGQAPAGAGAPQGQQATASTSPAASQTSPPTNGGAGHPATTTAPPSNDAAIAEAYDRAINHPTVIVYVKDEMINELVPKCKGHYHDPKEWPKCDPNRTPVTQRCTIVAACKEITAARGTGGDAPGSAASTATTEDW